MVKNKLTFNMVVSDAMTAMEFYEKVFNAVRGDIYHFPDKTGENEANVTIGGAELRLIDENKNYSCYSPKKGETDSIWLQVVVDDANVTLEKAVANRAVVIQEMSEFMGTRNVIIADPFGYTWTINQTLRETSFEERYQIYADLHKERENAVEEPKL